MRKVEVRPYEEYWRVLFETERRKLDNIFGPELVGIHHIGSTSIKGLKAKPIIDIMPVVKDIEVVNQFNSEMIAIGYEPRGENGIPGRRYLQKGGDKRTHHLHIFEREDKQIERHLAFRDYLRTHTAMKTTYGDLKARLSKQYPYDMESYIRGKEKMMAEIEWRALEWYQKKRGGEEV